MPVRAEGTSRVWLFDTHEIPEREAYLLLQHVAGAQVQALSVLLRPFGITPEQYHVLRILRDAGVGGLPCNAIGKRLVNGDPDVTRLLDRLEQQGRVSRTREANDRRVVTTRITSQGVRLLEELESPVRTLHRSQLGRLGARDLRALRQLLQRVARSELA